MDCIWRRHYDPEVPAEVDIPDVTLPELLYRSASDFPDNPAIIFLGHTLSYRRLKQSVWQAAAGLARLGFKPGQRLAMILPNCPQTVITYYATLHLGGIIVMLNPLAAPREILDQIQRTEADTVVALDHVAPKVEEVRKALNLKHLIIASLADYLPVPWKWLYNFRARRKGQQVGPRPGTGQMSFQDLLTDHAPPALAASSSDVAILQHTGGTTGLPKAAALTHRNLVSNVVQINAWLPHCQRGGERVLAVLPYFHVFGMTASMNWPINLAGAIILLPRFDAAQVLKTIHQRRPTVFPAAPTIFIALINHPHLRRYDLSSLWGCISGSAPLPQDVQEQFEALTKGRIIEGYGLTETSPVTHLNPIAGERRSGSIGLPFPNTSCRIVDAESGLIDLPPGDVGELLLQGPQVMAGYWQNPEETALALRHGWFYTGDLARMDEDGFFYIVDRKKDIIIASGYNIYPREVEEVLHQHPAVQDAVAFGVPDAYRGETVMAVVVPKPGMPVTAPDLFDFCRQRLAVYKTPKIIEFRRELPKTAVGKVLRRELRAEAEAKLKGAD